MANNENEQTRQGIDEDIDWSITEQERESFEEHLRGEKMDPILSEPITELSDQVDALEEKVLTHAPGCRSIYLDTRKFNKWEPVLTHKIKNRWFEIGDNLDKTLENILWQRYGNDFKDFGHFHVRPVIQINKNASGFNNINYSKVGKMITIRGVITSVSKISLYPTKIIFRCKSCGTPVVHHVNKYSFYEPPPSYCPNTNCSGQGKVKWDMDIFDSKEIDFQKAVIQEEPEFLKTGQQPRYAKVVIMDDMVGMVKPGSRAIITALLIAVPMFNEMQKKYDYPLFNMHLYCLNIQSLDSKQENEEKITEERREEIESFVTAHEGAWNDYFEFLIGAIAPLIEGKRIIKLALLASLVGGQTYNLPGGRSRGLIHVLLFGDPGTAKTQLITSLQYLSPRFKYASGQGSSKVGLTAAILKGESGPEVHGGVVVLADGGIAAIDEFDKQKPEDRSALHEQMEGQTVTVNKYGISETLNARTTIVAAANPKYGRILNPEFSNKTIQDQIDMIPIPILSRFDLIFLMKDEANAEKDSMMIRRMRKARVPKYAVSLGEVASNSVIGESDSDEPPDEFKNRIKFVRDLIILAKKKAEERAINVSKEAAREMEDFYIEMRSSIIDPDTGDIDEDLPIPITPRQYESLDRLSTAFAKARFSRTVDPVDVNMAKELIKETMKQTMIDEDGNIDAVMGQTGISGKRIDKEDMILRTIHKMQQSESNDKGRADTVKLKDRIITETNLSIKSYQDTIERLLAKGYVRYERGGKLIRLTSAGKKEGLGLI